MLYNIDSSKQRRFPEMKAFHEMTQQEATQVVNRIVNQSDSEEEIRTRLTAAGFNGQGAAVMTQRFGDMFQASVMVLGPEGMINV